MKYQKRYKPKTKFEKFLKVYFIIGILVIVLTGVYASVKSMQRKLRNIVLGIYSIIDFFSYHQIYSIQIEH